MRRHIRVKKVNWREEKPCVRSCLIITPRNKTTERPRGWVQSNQILALAPTAEKAGIGGGDPLCQTPQEKLCHGSLVAQILAVRPPPSRVNTSTVRPAKDLPAPPPPPPPFLWPEWAQLGHVLRHTNVPWLCHKGGVVIFQG